jgi:hypothetical protein
MLTDFLGGLNYVKIVIISDFYKILIRRYVMLADSFNREKDSKQKVTHILLFL